MLIVRNFLKVLFSFARDALNNMISAFKQIFFILPPLRKLHRLYLSPNTTHLAIDYLRKSYLLGNKKHETVQRAKYLAIYKKGATVGS